MAAVPDFFAAGWHTDSTPPGFPGNTVLNGHHNIYGEVFRDLDKVDLAAWTAVARVLLNLHETITRY